MKSFVQIITTPTADTLGTTLLLHFDNKRYMIGSLAEGIQRSSVQTGTKLMKVNDIFVTGRTEWQNTGGLVGMILTLADVHARSREEVGSKKNRQLNGSSAGSSTLNIFSPPNLNYQLAAARRFVFRKGMPVSVHEIERSTSPGTAPFWQEQNIKVWAMPIMPSSSRPVNPRKRSFEMLEDDNSNNNGNNVISKSQDEDSFTISEDLTQHERSKLAVRGIVGEMFGSNWKLDTLYETRLADVILPASIFIRDKDTHKIEKYKGPIPNGTASLPDPDLQVLVRKPWPATLIESLPPAKPAPEAISYIIRNHTQRGKFFPDKAKKLRVKPGKDYALLVDGLTVRNEDGELVTPDQVIGPSRPGGGFAVIDLPDASYVDNLIARPELQNQEIMAGVGAIVWSCGKGVAEDARLQAFIASMPNVRHVISSAEHCSNYAAFSSSAAATIGLGEIDSKRYPRPVFDSDGVKALSIGDANVTVAEVGLTIHLEPEVELNRDTIAAKLDVDAVLAEISPAVRTKTQEAHQALANDKDLLESWAQTIPGKDVEITTLGTGSALPSKYRNVSSTLMRVPGWGSLLFDCGENTLGQLKRTFPPSELKQIISELKAIVISHMHADHHLGIVSVIKAWYSEVHNLTPDDKPLPDRVEARFENRQRLAILAEPAMQNWLREFAQIEEYGYSRIAPLVPLPINRHQPSEMRWHHDAAELKAMHPAQRGYITSAAVPPSLLGLAKLETAYVQHCQGARAISITWPDTFKASYSGDCRPSRAFAIIGQGSTVCIHEATFDDELKGDAEAKMHSTTSEALGIAQEMGARTCVLTHFSQRYQKLPVIERSDQSTTAELPDQAADGEKLPETERSDQQTAAELPAVEHSDQQMMVELPAIEHSDQQTTAERPHHANDSEKHPQTDAGNAAEGTAEQAETYTPQAFGGEERFTKQTSKITPFKITSDMKVCVAFDYMRVKVGEIAEMQYFTPALLEMFAEAEKQAESGEANGEAVVTEDQAKEEKQPRKARRRN